MVKLEDGSLSTDINVKKSRQLLGYYSLYQEKLIKVDELS